MREQIRDKGRLQHILESIDYVLEFTSKVDFEEFLKNKLLQFAVIKNIEIIGEASYKITKEFKCKHPEIEWQVITDLRHVLVHGYYQIRLEVIWDIILKEIHPLREKIQQLYDEELLNN